METYISVKIGINSLNERLVLGKNAIFYQGKCVLFLKILNFSKSLYRC